MYAAPLAFAAMLASAGPQPLVLIPQHESEAECVVHERVAAVLDLIPEVRVLRTARQKGEKLDAARVRLRADLALARDGGTLAAAGKSTKTQPLGIDTFAALAAVWPPDYPPLPAARAIGAANADALMAACRSDATAAYALSGAAVGPVLRARIDPPASANVRVLERWAHASAAARRGDYKRALPALKLVVDNLSHGNIGPVWRRPAPTGAEALPSRLTLAGELLIAFEAGTFVALDPTSGEERWRVTLGTAEPNLIFAEKVLLAILEGKVVALDPKNGKTVWSIDLIDPHPEVVVQGGRIFAAGVEEMIAIEPAKGEVLWRFDPLSDVASGPSLVGTALVLPAATFVHVVNLADGKEKRKIDVKDEISSPLAVTPKGFIWALVGSDDVVMIDPERGEVTKRVTRFPGADWPPAIGGERMVLAARRGRRTTVAYFDPAMKSGLFRLFPGAGTPVLALGDYSGVVHPTDAPIAIMARNLDGKPLWTSRQRASIASLSSFDGVIAGATGTRAIMLDQQRGQQLMSIELDGRVTEVVLGANGGAAIVEKGAIYGLPSGSDPRPARWLEEARMELARAHVAMGQRPAALVLARAVLSRNPNQLEALALRAEASEARPGEAAADWLDLMARSPKGDPTVARAAQALARLVGVEARLTLDDPIEEVAIAGDTALVLAKGSATARQISDLTKIVWTKPAKQIGTALEGFEIDGAFFDRAGRAGLKRGKDQRLVADAWFGVEPGKAISRFDAGGKSKWRQTFDAPVDILAADARVVLVGDQTEGVQLLDANTGARKWQLPVGARAISGVLGDETVLIGTDKGWRALAIDDGKTRFDVAGTPGPAVRTSSGYLIGSGRRAIVVDERGKQRPIVMPDEIRQIAGSFAALEDGTLIAVDLAKAAIGGRVRLGPFKRVIVASGRLFGLREDGSLLVVDAERALRSR